MATHLSRRWIRRAGAPLALVLLGACGGGAAAGAGPATQPTTPAQVTTTAAPTTTTPPPPTTTLAPTTTIDQRAKVIADFTGLRTAFNACLADPAHCDVSTVAAPNTQRYTDFSTFIAKLDRHGLRGRPGDEDYTIIEDVRIAANGASATITTCIVDAGVIYDTRGNNDPADDVVVNDDYFSRRTTWTLQPTNGGWREAGLAVNVERRGDNICPPPGS